MRLNTFIWRDHIPRWFAHGAPYRAVRSSIFLTLVKVNQRWQIISKVFEFTEPEKPSDPSQK